jgi:hypothetical protein
MSFEILVRPAAAVPVLKPGSMIVIPRTEDDEAVLEWGSGPLATAPRTATESGPATASDGGSVNPPFDWQEGLSNILYPGDSGYPLQPGDDGFGLGVEVPPGWTPQEGTPEFVLDEKARKTRTVRITSPTDPANHVDVEVIDAIAFESQIGTIVMRFTNSR